MLPAANVLEALDDERDRLLAGWQQTLLDNLDDPIIQANFDLLKAAQRDLVQSFLAAGDLPSPVTPVFVAAVQGALSGLEKISVTGDDIKHALLAGESVGHAGGLAWPVKLPPVAESTDPTVPKSLPDLGTALKRRALQRSAACGAKSLLSPHRSLRSNSGTCPNRLLV